MSTEPRLPAVVVLEPAPGPSPRSVSVRLVREPLFHFLLLGGLIFAVSAWRERQRPAEDAKAHIEVTAGTIAWLREGFSKQWHREPDADDLRGLVSDHLREEVLYREALGRGWIATTPLCAGA